MTRSRAFAVIMAIGGVVACGDSSMTGTSSSGTGGRAPVHGCPASAFALFPAGLSPQCGDCMRTKCCSDIDACANDANCKACLSPDTYCVYPNTYSTLASCAHDHCTTDCYPTSDYQAKPACVADGVGDLGQAGDACFTLSAADTCNPLVQTYGCNWQAGATCDLDHRLQGIGLASGFTCFPSARHHVCEACGPVEGLCHFGLTCVNYQCMRFCCTNLDCGTGHCDSTWIRERYPTFDQSMASTLGVCIKP